MSENVVLVPRQAVILLARAGIKPPDKAGQLLGIEHVDELLAKSSLSSADRIQAKVCLRNAGLLPAGRMINDQRP
jgi:hypothetical protein